MSVMIETKRLILRTWVTGDIEPYYWINQDQKVIEYLSGPLSRETVEKFIEGANTQQNTRGYTLWAAEVKENHHLIGFIGLNYTDWESKFTPAVEVGWRLGSEYWGKGYATEGAKAALKYGFEEIGLNEIISFAVPENIRSIKVMEKLGLIRDFENDFNHPKLPLDHKLSNHVLYRLSKEQYLNKNKK